MPQHVGMHEEREFRSHARPSNHALISGYGQWRATLRDEDVWGGWGFAQEPARSEAPDRRRVRQLRSAPDDPRKFPTPYTVQRLKTNAVNLATKVVITTIQRLLVQAYA
jgi:hypothetical protein